MPIFVVLSRGLRFMSKTKIVLRESRPRKNNSFPITQRGRFVYYVIGNMK